MKHYFTGKPCKRGHVSNRLISDRSCLECTKEKIARYYKENPEKFRELRRQAYAANPEPEKAIARKRSAEWRKLNPKHVGTIEAKQRWKASNTAKVRAYTAKRRAAKIQRTPNWLSSFDLWVFEEAYELAALRTKLFGFSWHVDHIIPLQGEKVSGLHVPTNIQVISWIDNVSKANSFLPA